MTLAVIALASCSDDTGGSKGVDVVANFYPVAYAVERVGGEFVSVRNLTPAGVEPHDLELTSDDIDRVESADVMLYVGSGFQPAISNAVKRRDGLSADVARGLLVDEDPHFWLDPSLMARAVDAVARALADADPDNAPAYERNAADYKAELGELDADFKASLSACRRREFVTAHAAFVYLADRYGLSQHAISGVVPESEPDPQRLADLADLIRRDNVTTVFYEDLVPKNFADTLARETGAKTAVLNPLEGLSRRQRDAGATYVSVMRDNLTALARALECPRPPNA